MVITSHATQVCVAALLFAFVLLFNTGIAICSYIGSKTVMLFKLQTYLLTMTQHEATQECKEK